MPNAPTKAAHRRARPSRAAVRELSRRVCEHLRAWPPFWRAGCVLAYVPTSREADIWPLLRARWARGLAVALPHIVDARRGIMQARLAATEHDIVPGAFGIGEPMGPAISPDAIGLVLVPGLAFDAFGTRLGRGGGFYDRFLPRCPARRVGVALRVVPRLPREPHDARMHAVAGPAGVRWCGASLAPKSGKAAAEPVLKL